MEFSFFFVGSPLRDNPFRLALLLTRDIYDAFLFFAFLCAVAPAISYSELFFLVRSLRVVPLDIPREFAQSPERRFNFREEVVPTAAS